MQAGLFEQYLGLWVLIFLLIISLVYALIKESMLPKEKRGADTPVVKVFKQILMDLPSFLAFTITAALIVMIFMNITIPEIIITIPPKINRYFSTFASKCLDSVNIVRSIWLLTYISIITKHRCQI